MKDNTWKLALVCIIALTVAVPGDAALPGRSEAAPGVPAPDAESDLPRAVWPGPDGFGNTGSTCAYSWVDITSTGTSVALGDDDSGGPFAIGFTFPFYGTDYTDFYINSNGFISFGAGSTSFSNQCPLPSATTPDNLIALLWDDLNPSSSTDLVYYETFPVCPVGTGQCLVVLFNDYHHFGGASAGTFEAILFDSGLVRIQFLDAGDEEGSSSTTGMEGADAASDYGLTYGCDTASSITDNLCIEMGQVPGIALSPDTIDGSACPGSTTTVGMSLFNNSGVDATFALSYGISANATISGPATLFVANGATGAFDADVTLDAGLGHGTPVVGAVDASGGGYADVSAIAMNATVASEWLSLADTPAGVRFHAVAYHNGNIYQMGGETDWWTGTTNVQRYNIVGDSWDTPAALPAAVYGAGAATVGNNIYVIGGSLCTEDPNDGCTAGTFSDAVYIFDTAAGTWSTDATDPLPTALAYGSVVTDGSLIYHIGGFDVTGVLVNTLHIYDPAGTAGSRWSAGAPLATARSYAASGYINGSIYVAGGWTGGTSMTDTVEVYDVGAGTWGMGPAMPTPAAPYGSGDLGSLLIGFASGVSLDGSTTYTCSAQAYALDTSSGLWGPLGDLPRCLYGSEGVGDGTDFYGISGRTNEDGWHMALENQVGSTCGPIPVELMQLSVE